MRVFISGATGVLGHRLVERLTDRSHSIIGLARNDDGAALVEARGGRPHRGDILNLDSLQGVPDDIDVVVHAATSLPTEQKPSTEEWEQNDRIRLDGAKNLVEAFGDTIDRFVFPSVVWVARQPDGSPFHEESQRHPDRTTQSVVDVEDYLTEAAGTYGFGAMILRCGMFYAPDGAYTRQFGQNLLSGDMAIPGRGILGRQDAVLSMLHADDAALAFADAVDAGVDGTYHVVDEEPVTLAEYLQTFADKLGAPAPRRVPGWMARFAVGRETVQLLTTSMPTTGERFRRDVDWEPQYPTYHEGLTQVVETWKNDGTIRETTDGVEWVGA